MHVFHVIRSLRCSSISTNTQIAVWSQVNSPGHFNKRQISIARKCVFDIFERDHCIIWDDVVAIVSFIFLSFFHSRPKRWMNYKEQNHLIYLRRPNKSLYANWFFFRWRSFEEVVDDKLISGTRKRMAWQITVSKNKQIKVNDLQYMAFLKYVDIKYIKKFIFGYCGDVCERLFCNIRKHKWYMYWHSDFSYYVMKINDL